MRLAKWQVDWVRQAVNLAYEELGTWQKVADALADASLGDAALARSKSAWMQLAGGRKVSLDKANTVRAYYNLPLWKSDRTGISILCTTRDEIANYRQPDETWDAYLLRTKA